MNRWRLRQRYGFGSALVPLSFSPHGVPDRLHCLGAGLRLVAREARNRSWREIAGAGALGARRSGPFLSVFASLVLFLLLLPPEPERFAPPRIAPLPPEPPAASPRVARPKAPPRRMPPPVQLRPQPAAVQTVRRPRPLEPPTIDPLPPLPSSAPRAQARLTRRPPIALSSRPAPPDWLERESLRDLPRFPKAAPAALAPERVSRPISNFDRSGRPHALAMPALERPLPSVELPARFVAVTPHRGPSAHRATLLPAIAHTSPLTSSSAGTAARASLRGVPLGSLASCISDAQEDFLKRQLLAAVKAQVECNSAAGTYRFLQMQNLNAFLVWVEPDPERKALDRCGELRLALACLNRPIRRELQP